MASHFTRVMLSVLVMLPAMATADEVASVPKAVWNYMAGGNDDEGWGTISPDYAACDLGTRQSPVLIGSTKRSSMPPLGIEYRASKAGMEKKDRTIVTTIAPGNTLKDHGHIYQLQEIRIHIPAEHQVLDKLYVMELHLIHRDAKGKTLIVSVLAEMGDNTNPALRSLITQAPAKTQVTVPLTLNPKELLPDKAGYYAYAGSLSWPPCSEDVEWRIFKQPIPIAMAELKIIGKLIGRNARLLQPVYLRTITETIH